MAPATQNNSSNLPLQMWRGLGLVAYPLVRALLALRARRGKEDPARLRERLGYASTARPAGKLVWIHGASIGEIMSALPLVHRLLARDQGLTILLTSGTVTSAQLLARQLPSRCLHQFVPVDLPGAAHRFMAHWRPDVVLWLESDFWPLLLDEAKRSGARLALLQGRISPRSFRRWLGLPGFIRPLLRNFELCLAQSNEDRQRLALLGAEPVFNAGNLKAAAPPLAADKDELARLSSAVGDRPVWIAASTHPGEDELVLAAHRQMAEQHKGLLTIIVPRHPERGASIATLARHRGLVATSRSLNQPLEAATAVYIADTLGELGLFYRLAKVAFIGGSLVPHGGQNPLEPARLDCAILHGPWVQNFADIYALLDGNDAALPVADANALAIMAGELLADETRRSSLAVNAHAFATASDDRVLDQIMEKLAPILGATKN